MTLKCEWADRKAALNLKNHRVSFEEACTVFADTLSGTIPDPLHPASEARFITIGLSEQMRLLVVVHAEVGERMRIISARCATSHERKRYQEGYVKAR